MQLFYPCLFGGGEYLFFLITKELAKRGHNVYVITQRSQGTQQVEVIEGIKIYRVGPEFVFSGTLSPSIRYHLSYIIRASKKGRDIIAENSRSGQNIDIIHSNVYMPALSGQLCSRFYHIPHIVTFHAMYQAQNKTYWKDLISKHKKNMPFYTSYIAKLIEKFIAHMNVSAFHAVSELTKEGLVSFGVDSHKISVIHNGLDLMQYESSTDPDSTGASSLIADKPTAVFVGRLEEFKNVGTVIEAFKNIIKIIPEAQLVIVGDGPHKDTLMKQAGSISKSNIIFTGRIPVFSPQKIKIIKNSYFMVFPSIFEGLPMAIIESFACRKPVLACDVRPISDIVKDRYTGLLIPQPFDINAWTDKMIQLFRDKNMREQIGKNAYQEFLSNYEIEKNVSMIERLYQSITDVKNH